MNLIAKSALATLLFVIACSPKSTQKANQAEAKTMPSETAPKPPAIQQPFAPNSPTSTTTSSVGLDINGKIPVDPSIRIGTLANGMKYYIKKNNKPENRVELRLAVNTGSITEDPDQLGVAHFVEHMAFNGSKNFKKQELVDYLETIGTRFGADLNARTGFDETVYMLQARTDDAEKLSKGLLIMEDWASGITFDPVEIDKERGVVVSEWRSGLSPNQRVRQKSLPLLLFNSHYADRLPIGKPEMIEKVNYEAVKRYYRDWYRPELMAFVAVGDMDLDKMELEIKTRFSKIPASGSNVRKREKYEVPLHDDTKVLIATDKELPSSSIQVINKFNKKMPSSVQDYRNSLMISLYNSMIGARLSELSQNPNPPFNFAFSGYGDFLANLNSYTNFA